MNEAMKAWADFQGKKVSAVKSKRIKGGGWTEPEFSWRPADEVKVGSIQNLKDPVRPTWAWSLQATEETGPVRRCCMTQRVLQDGQCMIHVGGDWKRGVHVSALKPDMWHRLLGQPHGGDRRALTNLKNKYTREAKKDSGL